MGKPFGEGLKYIQMDVDISDNDKIDMLMDKFEHLGFAFWTLLHLRVFKNSYYWEQEDRKVNQFCRKVLRVPREKYNEMLEFSFAIKVFDKELFDTYNILTSKGIQRRYLIITRKWSKVKMITAYIIENVDVYPYQLSFYTQEGRYLGYKKKNSEELFEEEFIPRKHAKEITEENRAEAISTAIKEYFEPLPEPKEPETKPQLPQKPSSNGVHKIVDPVLTIDYYQDDQLSKDVLELFGYNQMSHSLYHVVFGQFMTIINKTNRIEEFKKQFYAYRDFKTIPGSFLHGFENFIGHQSERFEDGKWQSENWTLRLEQALKRNNKVNGKEARRGYTPENGYGEI